MAALRTGADLAHVFCTPGAAGVIKGYAPDLIVHPALPQGPSSTSSSAADSTAAITAWLPRFDAVVIGPGLGKDPAVMEAARGVLAAARAGGAGVVLDADGLALVCADPSTIQGYPHAILTPNAAEFGRLAVALGCGDGRPAGPPGEEGADAAVVAVAKALGGPALLLKGSTDRISSPSYTTSISGRGSLRRAGGQGDVLAGAAAAFLAWGVAAGRRGGGRAGASHSAVPAPVAAAAGGAALTRAAAARAFATHGRAMVVADVLGEVGPAFAGLFEND
jgi:ATP-dependent NAD(P)H-hydrate dehydratase